MRHLAGNRYHISCLLLGWGCTVVVVGADAENIMSTPKICSIGGGNTTRIVFNTLPPQYLFFLLHVCARIHSEVDGGIVQNTSEPRWW